MSTLTELLDIEEKVISGERLSFEDGLRLFQSDDLATIGRLANSVRRRRHGKRTYFNINRHLNPTNVCYWDCGFCAFYRKLGQEGAYTLSIEQCVEAVAKASEAGATEVHIVGGLHPKLPFQYYLDLLRALKLAFPKIHLKAFTMVELDHFKRITHKTDEYVIEKLLEAGLDSCPGGGAEIFHEEVRSKICKHKTSAERWLELAAKVHRYGIRSNATMLYGHIENYEHRVDHLLRLRALQDETGGFQCFIPLAFHPKDTEYAHLPGPSAVDSLKTVAVSRLLLDNFEHIKAYWVMLGKQLAQVALHFGANDLDGTVMEERITYAAGQVSEREAKRNELIALITEAGLEAVERDTLYRPIAEVAR
ncbi:MAG: aminofutalosine synthase MqnE [Acidobacteriota bacterium]|nr:aminofutalosine synthase MqnE [Blastocatellia bacterium]MDW8412161.1 aminofutalosine synthase MqnE [Acidobacteriota bacterium]